MGCSNEDDINDSAKSDPEGTVALDMTKPTEMQIIEFTNTTLFPFLYSFEDNDNGWCYASYTRSFDETMPYNAIRLYEQSTNPKLTPRECTLVLKVTSVRK
jgi:hypothetical protein